MDFNSERLPVPISNAVVTMELAGDRKSATTGVIVGIIAGMLVNMALSQLNAQVLFPLLPGTDMNDPAPFHSYITGLSQIALIVVLLAHLGQSFVGAWLAARLGKSHPMKLAIAVGIVSLIAKVVAMFMFDGPGWLAIELPLRTERGHADDETLQNGAVGPAELRPQHGDFLLPLHL